jgi:hypothetical protein
LESFEQVMISDVEEQLLHRAAMECIASDPRLNRRLILRSAAVLRYCYDGPRRTEDLDFVVVRPDADSSEDAVREPEHTRALLNDRLHARLPFHYPDYEQRLPWIQRELKIELAPCSEPIECRAFEIEPGSGNSLLVATLEDTIAAKLVAMLGPFTGGGKFREQDLFDIAELLGRPAQPINIIKTAELAHDKAKRRGICVSTAAFDNTVRWRLSFRYHTLAKSVGDAFVSFEDAWDQLLRFVRVVEGATCP